MTPEIRRAALRAAAKAALVVSLGSLGSIGCSGGKSGGPSTSSTSNTGGSTEPAAEVSCADYLAGLPVARTGELAADDPLKDRPDVYGAFASVADREAARTQTCCTEQLAADGSAAAQRWECCSALPAPDGMACTPWGPPCPPAMA